MESSCRFGANQCRRQRFRSIKMLSNLPRDISGHRSLVKEPPQEDMQLFFFSWWFWRKPIWTEAWKLHHRVLQSKMWINTVVHVNNGGAYFSAVSGWKSIQINVYLFVFSTPATFLLPHSHIAPTAINQFKIGCLISPYSEVEVAQG